MRSLTPNHGYCCLICCPSLSAVRYFAILQVVCSLFSYLALHFDTPSVFVLLNLITFTPMATEFIGSIYLWNCVLFYLSIPQWMVSFVIFHLAPCFLYIWFLGLLSNSGLAECNQIVFHSFPAGSGDHHCIWLYFVMPLTSNTDIH